MQNQKSDDENGPPSGIRSLISRMEASLSSLNGWFCAHALKVNASKTQLMVFGSRRNLRNLPHFKILFRDAELQPCAQARNLGVVFDGALSGDDDRPTLTCVRGRGIRHRCLACCLETSVCISRAGTGGCLNTPLQVFRR